MEQVSSNSEIARVQTDISEGRRGSVGGEHEPDSRRGRNNQRESRGPLKEGDALSRASRGQSFSPVTLPFLFLVFCTLLCSKMILKKSQATFESVGEYSLTSDI